MMKLSLLGLVVLFPTISYAQGNQDCWRVSSRPSIIDAITNRERAAEGPNTFRYETEMQRAACADPSKDSEEVVRRKIQSMVTRRWSELRADNMQCGNCSILEWAVHTKNSDFIADAIEIWNLPLNLTFEGRTVLDYISHRRDNLFSSGDTPGYFDMIRSLDVAYYQLRDAGAKHFRDVPGGHDDAPVNVEGIWNGGALTDRRTQTRMPVVVSLSCPSGSCEAQVSIPAYGIDRVRVTGVNLVGTQAGMSFEHSGTRHSLGLNVSSTGDAGIGGYRNSTMGVDSLQPVEWKRAAGSPKWLSRTALWQRNQSGFAGNWLSDATSEVTRSMTLQINGTSVTGTVRSTGRNGEVSQRVVGEMHGERRLVLRSSDARIIFWNLELMPDGRLRGTEGDIPGAGRILRLNRQ